MAAESVRRRFHSRGVSSKTKRAGCVETRSTLPLRILLAEDNVIDQKVALKMLVNG